MDEAQPIRRFLFPGLVALVMLVPGAAGAATESPGQASADAVAAALEKIDGIASDSAKAVGNDAAEAEDLHAAIEPVWETIEGAVKANDSAAYAAFEDNFTLLEVAAKASDPARAAEASESLSAAVESYLAEHPGDPKAASSGSRSAAAVESVASTGAPAPDNLPRTGPAAQGLRAVAGSVLCLGGLALIGGAGRRMRPGR